MKDNKKKNIFTMKITDELRDSLIEQSKKLNISKSALVTISIMEKLEKLKNLK